MKLGIWLEGNVKIMCAIFYFFCRTIYWKYYTL